MDHRLMLGFEDVTLSWRGVDYVVPANKQMMLIARLEDALTAGGEDQAISLLFRKNGPSHTRMAAAFGAALRYAGAVVTDEEIYLSIHNDIATGSKGQVATKVNAMILGLLAIISPPSARALTGRGASEKKA